MKELNEKFVYDPVMYKDLDPLYRFATSVIMFGSVLKSSPFAKELSWGDVLFHASEAANSTDRSQAQFVELVYKAKDFYNKQKKKKRKD
jgi:Ca-activated chloride channel family protein